MTDVHDPTTSLPPQPPGRILLTGASGYVGGRLLPRLLAKGLTVRCLARRPEFVRNPGDHPAEVVAGDVLDPASLDRAMAGVDVAFYLVHAMGAHANFEAQEREGARNFAAAARANGVRRIVYLGGLSGDDDTLSPHLRSRREVGRILRESGVPTLELRASIVLGAGSLSYEMIRSLVERLPIMVTPRWVRVAAQPIAIEDLIAYLMEALELPDPGSGTIEIGGADVVSYGELMREYARQRGLRRIMLPVPFLTPWLSSLWLGLVTPLYASIGRKLIGSITNPTVVRDASGMRRFGVRPVGVRAAIAAALHDEETRVAASRWCDARSSHGAVPSPAGRPVGSPLRDARERAVAVPPVRAFAAIAAIGGERGWYAFDWMWRLRGAVDRVLGGVGMRRGRGPVEHLRPGAVIDFWRVEAFEPDRRLRLEAEMLLPGRAWLDFEVEPTGAGALIRQTALFVPRGLAGRLYWWSLYPFHHLIFGGMLAGIARHAERATAAEPLRAVAP